VCSAVFPVQAKLGFVISFTSIDSAEKSNPPRLSDSPSIPQNPRAKPYLAAPDFYAAARGRQRRRRRWRWRSVRCCFAAESRAADAGQWQGEGQTEGDGRRPGEQRRPHRSSSSSSSPSPLSGVSLTLAWLASRAPVAAGGGHGPQGAPRAVRGPGTGNCHIEVLNF
jgi:hypothetical protein